MTLTGNYRTHLAAPVEGMVSAMRMESFEHEDDCQKYYLCDGGNGEEMTCEEGTYFDADKKQCVQQGSVDCTPSEPPLTTTGK